MGVSVVPEVAETDVAGDCLSAVFRASSEPVEWACLEPTWPEQSRRVEGDGHELVEESRPGFIEDVVQWALAEAEVAPRRKPLPWSEGEDEFLRQSLGILSEEAIGVTLGRTPTAVHLRWKRDLGLPAPSKTPGYVTAHQAADMLAVDVHAVCRWIESGWLPARLLPFRNRKVWRIRVGGLRRFAVKPEHWVLFRPERVRDPALARLVALAVERWDDEWLSTGRVAEICGTEHQNVASFIRAGKLPAVKWNNWRIRRSDAERVHFPKGRGHGCELDWSEEGDVFLILARAIGCSHGAIARLMDYPFQRIGGRLTRLHCVGQIPLLVAKYGLEEVQYRQEDGRLLADWRLYRERFPTLARAMDRFAAGEDLSPVQMDCVRGVLWAWGAFYLGREHSLARRLQIWSWRRGRKVSSLRELYQELSTEGVDPLRDGGTRRRM